MNELPEYDKFRTGYTFKEIRRMLSREQKERYKRGQYMFVTRATVLGRWHELKQKMYADEEKYYLKALKLMREVA